MNVAITLHGACSGGGHAKFNVSVDGGQAARVEYQTDDLLVPLANGEHKELVLMLLRARVGGMTRAQARTAMQSVIEITI